MESLLQHLDRFSEVLAASRTTHVRTWEPATVRRALQWAAYLRHIHRRFGRHALIRKALERRLQNQWKQEGNAGSSPAPALADFQALGHCDQLLSLRLLANPALGDASFHYLLQQLFPGPGVRDAEGEMLQGSLARLSRRRAAIHLLHFNACRENSDVQEDPLRKTQAELLLRRLQEVGEAEAEGPGRLLSSLWGRLSQNNFLEVVAAALLLPPPSSPRLQEKELERGGRETPSKRGEELLRWLLGRSDVMVAFCRSLPAGLLTLVAGRHPELSRVYLALLTDWGRQLHYDLQKGLWIGTESQAVPWEELFSRFQSLCRAPPPLKDEILTALTSCKAQDGDFEVPGLSIWTDLLLALGSSA
ncbi:Fanconi anemia group F protein [Hippopotamus amphibius kiboko]|uniref:Fanconi anemia group F protein n=1 Tax=Hippopotamus amphibius kiboko TaxID=575201 RepID=UPI00259A35FF|nr:Fanconi anemia group F protein [Hippopotamus amphibius kiboko]